MVMSWSWLAPVSSNSGQSLKRVEVIEDDEAEIVEAIRRMSSRYDFVVTRRVHLLLKGSRPMPS